MERKKEMFTVSPSSCKNSIQDKDPTVPTTWNQKVSQIFRYFQQWQCARFRFVCIPAVQRLKTTGIIIRFFLPFHLARAHTRQLPTNDGPMCFAANSILLMRNCNHALTNGSFQDLSESEWNVKTNLVIKRWNNYFTNQLSALDFLGK